MSTQLIQVRVISGKGRPFVLLGERGNYEELLTAVAQTLACRAKVIWLETVPVGPDNWEDLSGRLGSFFQENGIRQASLVTFGATSAVAQNFYLHEPRSIRTMTFIDAATRPHPTVWQRIVDRAEGGLPLGFPFRLRTGDFDVKPFLQRLRTPVLVVTTDRAHGFLHHEAQVMHRAIPTSWSADISQAADCAQQLSDLLVSFQDVAAKCPQKNQSLIP